MGEAKRRREKAVPTVYHHTSILRTNLLWMSGVIEVEGKGKPAIHPKLGEIRADVLMRRNMTDFPAVAWFTTRREVPKCLVEGSLFFINPETGASEEVEMGSEIANAIAMNRLALGFPISEIGVTPWKDYYGYATPEGRELNDTARAVGDDPDDWYISETPVDILRISELYVSRRSSGVVLERDTKYLPEIRRMVTFCHENEGAYMLPTWLPKAEAHALAERLGIPVHGS